MKLLAIACYIIGLGLLPFAFQQASQPSAIPIAAVVGAFILPALFIWWGSIFWKKAKAAERR